MIYRINNDKLIIYNILHHNLLDISDAQYKNKIISNGNKM